MNVFVEHYRDPQEAAAAAAHLAWLTSLGAGTRFPALRMCAGRWLVTERPRSTLVLGGDVWDPAKYLDYGDLRARPFFELIGRIGAGAPERVVDLGCGPGNLTAALAERWPRARLEAFDSSPEMVAAAQEAGIDAEVADVRDWEPAPGTDVVVSNAVLQWVPGHAELLRRWIGRLRPGAWLAVQVPGNFDAPSHVLTRRLAATAEWAPRVAEVVLREDDAVHSPEEYATLFADLGCAVDAWETTYVQRLDGPDAVLEWITGTALRPVRAALDTPAWQEFRAQLAAMLDEAYPPRADGTTWFPFRRVFAVAQVSAAALSKPVRAQRR